MTVEAALNAGLTEHLGYEKHQPRKGKKVKIFAKQFMPLMQLNHFIIEFGNRLSDHL